MDRRIFIKLFSTLASILPNQSVMIHNKMPERKKDYTEWIVSNFIGNTQQEIKITGKPGIINSKYGNAVTFNGTEDAIFIDSMPLESLKHFTIEAIFQPFSGGNFEQRFLHIGEIQGDRVLLEIRSTQTDWYFDGFISTGEEQCALIDPGLLHPLDQWYHVAYIVDDGDLVTYVNGKKELEGHITLNPLKSGKTSIGVRQNNVSWFKGAICKIRISPKSLKPKDFMPY